MQEMTWPLHWFSCWNLNFPGYLGYCGGQYQDCWFRSSVWHQIISNNSHFEGSTLDAVWGKTDHRVVPSPCLLLGNTVRHIFLAINELITCCNRMQLGFFSLAVTALKLQTACYRAMVIDSKYPYFYIFPLEFRDIGDVYKHQNSRT